MGDCLGLDFGSNLRFDFRFDFDFDFGPGLGFGLGRGLGLGLGLGLELDCDFGFDFNCDFSFNLDFARTIGFIVIPTFAINFTLNLSNLFRWPVHKLVVRRSVLFLLLLNWGLNDLHFLILLRLYQGRFLRRKLRIILHISCRPI